jgi:hypothetical protein
MWPAIARLAELALALLAKVPGRAPSATLSADEAQAARTGQSAGAAASREGKLAPKRASQRHSEREQ